MSIPTFACRYCGELNTLFDEPATTTICQGCGLMLHVPSVHEISGGTQQTETNAITGSPLADRLRFLKDVPEPPHEIATTAPSPEAEIPSPAPLVLPSSLDLPPNWELSVIGLGMILLGIVFLVVVVGSTIWSGGVIALNANVLLSIPLGGMLIVTGSLFRLRDQPEFLVFFLLQLIPFGIVFVWAWLWTYFGGLSVFSFF
jgi:ribosomal protein S27E